MNIDKLFLHQIFLLLIISWLAAPTYSQTLIPRFEKLEVNDGLAHNSVYSIYQDKKGFMWFGTPNGLNRYDGNEIQTYQYTGNNSGMANNFVRGNILEDDSGNIWYSNENGLYRWSAIHEKIDLMFNFKTIKNFVGAGFTICVHENSIWLLDVDEGILEYSIKSGSIKIYPLPTPINLATYENNFYNEDKNGNLWIRVGNDKSPLFSFNIKSKEFTIQYANNSPSSIFFSKKDEQLLIYKNEIVIKNNKERITKSTSNISKYKESVVFKNAIKDKYGRWWLTTNSNGLFLYNTQKDEFTQFLNNNLNLKSLPFNITTNLAIDRNQNLWIGSDGGGVGRLNLKQPMFNLFPLSVGAHPELSNYFTKCFYEDNSGRIWFGTHSDGLNIYNPTTDYLVNYRKSSKKESLPGNIVGAIFKDAEGNLWIGSNGGLSIFNEETGKFNTIPLKGYGDKVPSASSLVFKIKQLKNGNLICATWLGIIEVKKINGSYVAFARKESYLNRNATDIIEMPENIIFVATGSGTGLLRLKHSNNRFDSVTTLLPGIDIRSITQSIKNPNYLWIGSGIGLIYFNIKTNNYQIYNENNGLPNNYVYGALEDDKGNLWISTNRGLSFFDFQKNKFSNYSFYNGLQSNEFNTQAFYRGPSGNFYFGGVKGFNWFKERKLDQTVEKPSVDITNIEINGLKFLKDADFFNKNTIEVSYEKNYFSFEIAALDFTLPDANKVKYMLQGWETNYITTDNKIARYSNLPPGNYTFKVRAANADGIWSDEKNLQIYIKAPFWKTPTFLTFLLIAFILSVIYITFYLSRERGKRKMRLLEKQIAVDAERFRIGADMHDEIGSSITHIALLSELARSQKKSATELKDEMKIISTSARRLVQSMSEIIWTLNPQNDTLENLTAYMREQFREFLEPFNILFEIYFPDEIPLIKLNNEERRNLFLVTKELLNNALKHSKASIISLSLIVKGNQLIFRVSDNGIGMKQSERRLNSNGIKNLKKRMKDIGGSIEWKQMAPGTAITYIFPYK
jgi:signal transduction histidine kinase/ligand-binding sensor domain-containing protein